MSNRAWVTLATNDSYGLGALVLAASLRRAGSSYPAVVLITPSVTEAMRNRLSAVFTEVITVDVLDSRDAAHLALLQRPELGITFTKIHCWNLTQYQKCVFLDADTLVVQNCDELFEREELSAAPDVGWPDCFNSGVFVFTPSTDTFTRLVTFAQERGSFDGGDQGLLNSFFSDWAHGDINKHLPFLYNVTSAAFYSYLPALKHYGQNLKIIHFIGAAKPWLQSYNWQSRTVNAEEHVRGLLQLWWDIFVSQVHAQLDTTMSGVAGNLARVVPGDVGYQREALDELTRRQGWEAGNIDYMGADSFDNIWAKISQTLNQPRSSPPKQPSPPPKEPSPPKEPVVEALVAVESVGPVETATPAAEAAPEAAGAPVEAVVSTEAAPPAAPVQEASTEAAVPVEESIPAPTVASTEAAAPTETVQEAVAVADAAAPVVVAASTEATAPTEAPVVAETVAPQEATPASAAAETLAAVETPAPTEAPATVEAPAAPEAPAAAETPAAAEAPAGAEAPAAAEVPAVTEAPAAPEVVTTAPAEAPITTEAPQAPAQTEASQTPLPTEIPVLESTPAEAPAAEAPKTEAPVPQSEVPKTVEEAIVKSESVPVVEAAAPKEKTESAVPPTPPVTPKSTPEASTPVTELPPVSTDAPVIVEAASPVSPPVAAEATGSPAAAEPAKPESTPEKALSDLSVTDSPPLANTPSKEETPAVPSPKSEERKKPAGKLQLSPPAAIDPVPTPDSELEDAAALAQSIIASELSTTVTSSTPSTEPTSPPAPIEEKRLAVEEPEVPTPPVSLAQIGVKSKPKSTTAAQIESSVTDKPEPGTPTTPTTPPADAPIKKKVVKKVVKKDASASGDASMPVPPPRKKEKKPKEK